MKLFFDLDGTLIDSRLRLYNLFQELIPHSSMSFDEYWQLKRNKVNHETILKQFFSYKREEIDLFTGKWMGLIEDVDWLMLDKPFEGATEHLSLLKESGHDLFLVTARQFKSRAVDQVVGLGWQHLFKDLLVTEQKFEKTDLIKPLLHPKDKGWMIGDTGKDVQAGKLLKLKTAAVLTGFLSKDSLLTYAPDKVLERILDFYPEN